MPALLVGNPAIWDSLAILEFLAETRPEARLWPATPPARAHARATAAEMHAGFAALREHCPMDFVARLPMATLPDPVAAEVCRILALSRDCRAGMMKEGRFSSVPFRQPTPCTHPSPLAFAPIFPILGPTGTTGTRRRTSLAWEEAARLETGAGPLSPRA